MSNIPCGKCKYDPTLAILGSWMLELPMEAKSKNDLKDNSRFGHGGRKYRAFRDKCERLMLPLVRSIPTCGDTEKRRVFFTRLYCGRSRDYDDDNLIAGFKPVRDCLKTLNMIHDDSPRWLEAHYDQKKAEYAGMVITIESVAWNEPEPVKRTRPVRSRSTPTSGS